MLSKSNSPIHNYHWKKRFLLFPVSLRYCLAASDTQKSNMHSHVLQKTHKTVQMTNLLLMAESNANPLNKHAIYLNYVPWRMETLHML